MSREKVKTFTVIDNIRELEIMINTWLEKNNDIIVISRQVMNTAGIDVKGEPFISFTVLIFYRETYLPVEQTKRGT